MAWAAFEELLTDAEAERGSLRAHTNVRGLADRIGVGLDTAASALRRLQRLGLVEREAQPVDRRGRFSAGCYLLTVPRGVLVAPCRAEPATAKAHTGAAPGAAGQAPLFDFDNSTASTTPNSKHHRNKPTNPQPRPAI